MGGANKRKGEAQNRRGRGGKEMVRAAVTRPVKPGPTASALASTGMGHAVRSLAGWDRSGGCNALALPRPR